jgi:hypothetical protein
VLTAGRRCPAEDPYGRSANNPTTSPIAVRSLDSIATRIAAPVACSGAFADVAQLVKHFTRKEGISRSSGTSLATGRRAPRERDQPTSRPVLTT